MQNTFSSGAAGILGECLDSFSRAYAISLERTETAFEQAEREEEESREYYECRPVCDADLGWGVRV